MADFIRTADLVELTEEQYRAEFPSISFPAAAPEMPGYAALFESPQPAYDALTQQVVRAPAEQVNGRWFKVWAATALPPEVAAANLAKAVADKCMALTAAYATAIAQPVTYSGHEFQADPQSIFNLQSTLLGYSTGDIPADFYWVAADNARVPMTYAGLQALAAAMLGQGWAAFKNLQDKKAQARAAQSGADLAAITW